MTLLVPAVLGGTAILVMVVMSAVQQRRARVAARPSAQGRPRILIHSINDDRCTGCDACVAVCPTNVLDLIDNKSRVVRFQDCIQCEACMWSCPTEALVMHPEGTEAPMLTVPELDADYQTAVPGQYLIGEVAGKPLIKNAANIGRGVVEHMLRTGVRPRMRRRAEGSDAGEVTEVDVAIVGSGPGGLSAALTCAQRGLSHVILEKEQILASTIARYPKGKLIMAEPYDCRNLSLLPVFDSSKEQIVPLWEDLVRRVGLNVCRGEAVERVQRRADGTFDVRTTVAAYRAQRVVLATGLRGKPRTLGVPGENLPMIHSLLEDPDVWRGKPVTVVGGGDSALEAAMALADSGAKVLLSYRGRAFARAQHKNKQAIASYAAQRRIKVKFQTQVAEFSENSTTLRFADGTHKRYPSRAAFVLIGADPPVKWLERLGVRFVQRPHGYQLGPTDGFVQQLVPDAIDCPQDSASAAALVQGADPREIAARAPAPQPAPPKLVESGRKLVQSASAIFTSARRLEKPMPLSEFARQSRKHTGMGRRDALPAAERTRVLRMLRDDGARLADEDSRIYAIEEPSGVELGWDEPSPVPTWDESSPFSKGSPAPMHLSPDELDIDPAPAPDVPLAAPREAVIVGLAKVKGQRRRASQGNGTARTARHNGKPRKRPSSFHTAPTVQVDSVDTMSSLLAQTRDPEPSARPQLALEDPTAYIGPPAPPGDQTLDESFDEATRAVEYDAALLAATESPNGHPVTSVSSVVIEDEITDLADMSALPDIPRPMPPSRPKFRHVETISDVDFDFDD